jgi:hypothetical protein
MGVNPSTGIIEEDNSRIGKQNGGIEKGIPTILVVMLLNDACHFKYRLQLPTLGSEKQSFSPNYPQQSQAATINSPG